MADHYLQKTKKWHEFVLNNIFENSAHSLEPV